MTDLNNTEEIQRCPYCGSEEILPFEEDKTETYNQSFTLIWLSAFSLFTAYILFLLSAYLFFPGVVILSIYFFTRVVNEREKRRTIIYRKKYYICTKCNTSFEGMEKIKVKKV